MPSSLIRRSLAQLFAISPAIFEDQTSTEMYVTYYDIFTRNAFQTYKDVLLEVGKLMSSTTDNRFFVFMISDIAIIMTFCYKLTPH